MIDILVVISVKMKGHVNIWLKNIYREQFNYRQMVINGFIANFWLRRLFLRSSYWSELLSKSVANNNANEWNYRYLWAVWWSIITVEAFTFFYIFRKNSQNNLTEGIQAHQHCHTLLRLHKLVFDETSFVIKIKLYILCF